jgi:hypothetical protein
MSRYFDRSIVRGPAFVLFMFINIWVWTACDRQALTPFEKVHAEAVQQNPESLRVELRTRDGRSTYHLYENIPIDLLFSSSKLMTYSIELSEGMNVAGGTDRFSVEPTDTVFESNFLPYGIICCGSQRPYLWNEPTVLHRDLTDFLRFQKPGRYQVFYKTRRVFRGKAIPNSKDIYQEQSAFTATSNLLNLTILPDDPNWDARRLSEVLGQMNNPRVRKAHDRAVAAVNQGSALALDLAFHNEFPETEFERARTAFQALDSDEAIEQRILLIPKLERHTYTGSMPITFTTQPERMFLAMQKRAEQRDFGVDDNYASWWIQVLAKRDHPEFFRPTANEESRKERAIGYAQARAAAAMQILQLLEVGVTRKNRGAQVITRHTIQDLRHDMHTR